MKKFLIGCLLTLCLALAAGTASACPMREGCPGNLQYPIGAIGPATHTIVCKRCGGSITEAHSLKKTYIFPAPTCTTDGLERDQCDCAFTIATRTVPALKHDITTHPGKAPTCTEKGWNAYETCSRCDYNTYSELVPTGHKYAAYTTQPTCTKAGYTTHTCANCKDSYTDGKTAASGHWFGEWTPTTDDAHTARCRNEGCGYRLSAACSPVALKLSGEDKTVKEFSLCPVCGEADDGTHWTLEARATAKSVRLPRGEVLVRVSENADGERLMAVGFEFAGKLTQAKKPVTVSVPAELLEEGSLRLVSADGTETELPFTVKGKTASFTLEFGDNTPVRLLRLLAA